MCFQKRNNKYLSPLFSKKIIIKFWKKCILMNNTTLENYRYNEVGSLSNLFLLNQWTIFYKLTSYQQNWVISTNFCVRKWYSITQGKKWWTEVQSNHFPWGKWKSHFFTQKIVEMSFPLFNDQNIHLFRDLHLFHTNTCILFCFVENLWTK